MTYDLPGYGWPESIYPTSDGGYAITGMTYYLGHDVFLVKTSAEGDLQWSSILGGPGSDWGESVVPTPDGGYVIAGVTSPSLNGYTDIYLVKTDETGQEQWSRSFGTDGPDQGNAVIATDGGYLLAGTIFKSNNNGYSGSDGYLVKVSPEGDQLWTRSFIEPGMYGESFHAIQETNDGGYIIAGTVGKMDNKICLVKVNKDGKKLWSRTCSEAAASDVGDIRQTTDGGYVITGSGGTYNTLYLLHTDRDGKMLWYKEYDTFGRQFSGTVEQLPDGGFIAGGACLVRTDKDGNLLWAERTNNSITSFRTAVVANSDGSYTVTGGVKTGANMIKPILIKTVPVEKATISWPDQVAGWMLTSGMALGIFVMVAGVIIVILLVGLIVGKRVNSHRKR